MSRSVNKKRSVSLVYEFLIRTISKALVDGDKRRSSRALKLIKKHFKPGTELYREFRLVNSLIKTTVSSEAVAASILQEAKNAARSHDITEIDRNKSFLISDINKSLNFDGMFYDQQIDDYKFHATIHTLINEWRSKNTDIELLAQYEDQLIKYLTTEKTEKADHMIDESVGTNRLLMKMMMNKLNEKYSTSLTPGQKMIIRLYAFSGVNDDNSRVREHLKNERRALEPVIATHIATCNDKQLVEKLNAVQGVLLAESLDVIDDDTIARFMLYSKLRTELLSNDGDENE